MGVSSVLNSVIKVFFVTSVIDYSEPATKIHVDITIFAVMEKP
jgi:hypothetical protein